MADIIKLRRDTAARWLLANPILDIGEKGIETDTLLEKVGDGETEWSQLPYSRVECLSDPGQSEVQPMSQKAVTDAFNALATDVFPLTVAIASSNAGTREIGTSVAPNIVLSITRKGSDVSSSAQTTSSQGTVQSDHKTIIGSALTSGTTTYQISVTQGGQTKSAPNQVFDFMNYMYYGEVSTKPANAAAVATLCENNSLGKQLSRATTKSSTNLAANKYYVFAVKGSVNLVCRHAGTDAVVTGCTTGTTTIQRVNHSGSDSYSYIIVEKSSSAWSFKITNS